VRGIFFVQLNAKFTPFLGTNPTGHSANYEKRPEQKTKAVSNILTAFFYLLYLCFIRFSVTSSHKFHFISKLFY
jgi:hypothetical protein